MNFEVVLPAYGAFSPWREAARALASHRVAPGDVVWREAAEGPSLFPGAPPPAQGPHPVMASRDYLALARLVLRHRDPARFSLLYEALLRGQTERGLIRDSGDPLIRRLVQLAQAVRRDRHKMKAFLRFHARLQDGVGPDHVAWFEPEHRIVDAVAPFFARRFASMDWAILTPERCAFHEGGRLGFGPGVARPDFGGDAAEALWDVYYRNIFNPARVKLSAMRAEMPKKYWKNLSETRQIPQMLREAEARVAAMRAAAPSAPPVRAARIAARRRDADSS